MWALKSWMTSWRAAAGKATVRSARRRSPRRSMAMASASLLRGARAEAYFGDFALGRRRDFEELARLEAEHVGDDVGGEDGNFRVQVAHDGVVVAPRVLDRVFDLIERLLELREAFDGAKLRIGFGEGEDLPQRLGEHAFGLGLRGGPLHGHCFVARGHDAFERFPLVPGVALHGFNHVGDQVVAALELDVNVGPGVVAPDAQTHQAVVHYDDQDNDDRDD